jgi:hypothetical protein
MARNRIPEPVEDIFDDDATYDQASDSWVSKSEKAFEEEGSK